MKIIELKYLECIFFVYIIEKLNAKHVFVFV